MNATLRHSLLVFGLITTFSSASHASKEPQGNYTDRPLSSTTNPGAPLGNDLLLAESVPGSYFDSGTNLTVHAETWTTDLNVSLDSQLATSATRSDFFSGSGPTGQYANGTAGTGKHTADTSSLATKFIVPGNTFYYRYVMNATFYDSHNNSKTIAAGGSSTIYSAVAIKR